MLKPFLISIAVLTGPALAQDAARGQALYERYCTSCHGIDATGVGPLIPVLEVQPANLTRLSANNGGTFPLIRVVKRIDGRDPLVSHGSPMPVYGDFFEPTNVTIKAESGQMIMTSQPVVDLVAYLKTLQVK
jgi:hypothetical protein